MNASKELSLFAFGLLCIPTLLPAVVNIGTWDRVGHVSTSDGDGLIGTIYSNAAVETLAAADSYIAGNSPNDSFVALSLDYPGGSSDYISSTTTLNTFLGTSLTSSGLDSIEGTIIEFDGFINIRSADDSIGGTSEIDIAFDIGSNDGHRLTIAGHTITSKDNATPFARTAETIAFASEGIYTFNLIYYDFEVNAGLEVHTSIFGGDSTDAPFGTSGILPSEVLFQSNPTPIPEPGSFSLFLSGIAFLLIWIRRRK